jgi:hypothetical protein
MYDATLGRFLQRDGAAFVDGLNLYAAYFVPGAGDPQGQEIVTRAPIDDYLKANGVAGYKRAEREGKYYYTGTATYDKTKLTSEILEAMINSKRSFAIKGSGEAVLANLRLHVLAREKIVGFAEQFKVPFGTMEKWSAEFWTRFRLDYITKGSPYTAVSDIFNNPKSYELMCGNAMLMVIARGVAEALGQKAFDELIDVARVGNWPLRIRKRDEGIGEETDWVPGDYGYIENQSEKKERGEEGENIIYLGNGRFWGQAPGKNILSLAEWKARVGSWGGGKVPARLENTRASPIPGLEG